MSKAILYDSTLCVGCRACEQACATKWGLPYNDKIGSDERLSAHKLTTIRTWGDKYIRRLCMHCAEPACVSVCPVGALQKTALGPVIYDQSRCMGCRYCLTACPFQVPVYEWSSRLPRVRKCDMCYERQLAGKPTACAEACPTNATICGDRHALIAEAKKRLADKPGQYHPYIYGLNEVGGTSVLFLSPVNFAQLGLRTDLPKEALPVLTWHALSHVPDVVSMGAVLMGGIFWITHRREDVAKAEKAAEPRRVANGDRHTAKDLLSTAGAAALCASSQEAPPTDISILSRATGGTNAGAHNGIAHDGVANHGPSRKEVNR